VDGFLKEILEEGWDDQRRKAFIAEYGKLIITSILYHIRNYYPAHQVNTLREHLEAILKGKPVRATGGIVGDLLDVSHDTYNDVLLQVFGNDLIGKYAHYVEKRKIQSAKFIDFKAFLQRNVRYRFFGNISRGLSQKELFDKILTAKSEDDRHYFIHEARNRYAEEVKAQFRSKFAQLSVGSVNNVIDYFFEQYVPCEYQKLVDNLSGKQLHNKTLFLLIEHFSQTDCQQGPTYHGQIFGPTVVKGSRPESYVQGSTPPVDEIFVNDEIHRYYAMMVKCKEPDPGEIEQQLIPTSRDPKTICCLAFACLKKEFGEKERQAAQKARNKSATEKDREWAKLTKSQKENLRALAISHCTRERGDPPPRPLPTLYNLAYEDITRWKWRWEDDICEGLFNKRIRKDRVQEQLCQWLLKSKYKDVVS